MAQDSKAQEAISVLEALPWGDGPLGNPVFTAPEQMSPAQQMSMAIEVRRPKGIKEGFTEGGLLQAIPFLESLSPLAEDDSRIKESLDAIESGTATQAQFDAVLDWTIQRSRPGGVGYHFAQGIKSSVALGGEMLLTGPVFRGAKAGASKALGAIGKQILKEGAEVRGASLLSRIVASGVGVEAQVRAIDALQGLSSLAVDGEWNTIEDADALRRALPEFDIDISETGHLQVAMAKVGEVLGDKRYEAHMARYWELAMERSGPAIAEQVRKIPIGKKLLMLEEDFFKWMRGKKYWNKLDDVLASVGKKAQIHRFTEEYFEERATDIAKALTPGLEEDFGDILQTPAEAIGEAGALAVPGTVRALAGRMSGQSADKAIEKLGIIQDLTGSAPSPADQQLQEAGLLEEPSAETPARAPSAPLTQPGGAEAIVQEGLRGLSERAGEEVTEAVDLSPEEAKVLEGLSRAAEREGREVRIFEGPEGLDVQGQQAGEGVTLLNRKLLSDPTLAADVDFEEAWHDIGSKDREILDEAIGLLQAADPEGFAEAVEADRAARPDLSDDLREEEAVGTYAQGHRALVQYLQTEKGKAALEGFYEKDRTGFQKFVAAVRRLLSKLGLADTYEDKLLKRLSTSIGYDVSVPEAKAADVLSQAFSAIQRRGWMPPSQRPTGPELPGAETSARQEGGKGDERLAVEGAPAPKQRRKKGQRAGSRPILTQGESIRYAVAKAAAAEEKHLLPNAKAKIPSADTKKGLDAAFRGWMSKRLHAQEWAKAQAAKNEQTLIASIPGRSVGEVLKEAVSDQPSRRRVRLADQAMHLYIDLKGKAAEEYEKFSDDLTVHQRRVYRLSQNLSPEVQALANRIMAENDSRGDYLREAGIISSKVQHYSARYWEQEEGRGTPGSAKFKQTTGRSKHREYSSILQGWADGRKLRTGGAIGSQLEARLETANVLHDRALIKAGIKAGILSTKNQDGWSQVNHPNFWQKVEHVGKATAEDGEVDVDIYGKDVGATQEGDIFRYRIPLYAPEHLAKKLNNVLDRSWFADKKGWSWLAKWNAIIKANILFSSLFHHQAFLRSYMFGTPMHWGNVSTVLNPIKGYRLGREAIDLWTPEVQELIDSGLTLQRDRDIDEAAMREKTRAGAIIDKAPGAKQAKNALVKLRDQQVDFLFHRMGPHLKVMAALLEYRHLVIKHRKQLEAGTTTKPDLAQIAASMANADFGGLNLDIEGRSQTMRQINRFFMLAPDWTESNVRTMLHSINPKGGIKGKAYRAMWARVGMRAIGATLLFNMLMAGMDDDDEDPDGKTFWTRYQRAWEEGNLRVLEADITPIYRAVGGKSPSRKYFSILGHFRDPIKFMKHWGRSGKHKVSVVGGTLLEAIEGSDWAGRPFTSWQEFIGIDDKGTYKTSRRGKDGNWIYRRGDPKGGKLKGETVSWRSTSGKGAIGWEELPSFAINQGKGFMPIQIQNLTAWLMGEMDGFDALTKSAGLMTATTRPRPPEDRIDALLKEMRDTDDQNKRRDIAEKIATLRKTRGTQ